MRRTVVAALHGFRRGFAEMADRSGEGVATERVSHEAKLAAIARNVVQAHARGSVPLQLGLYRTPVEIDAEL